MEVRFVANRGAKEDRDGARNAAAKRIEVARRSTPRVAVEGWQEPAVPRPACASMTKEARARYPSKYRSNSLCACSRDK